MPGIPVYPSLAQQKANHIQPVGLVLHRTEASFNHLLGSFQTGTVTPHFMVGKKQDQIAQFVDTDLMAAHVLGANRYYIGIEFESINARPGYEHRQDPLVIADDLTPYQTWMGYKIVDWICQTHHIPKLGPPTSSQWIACGGFWQGVLGHADVASGGFFPTTHGDTLQSIDFCRLGVFPF